MTDVLVPDFEARSAIIEGVLTEIPAITPDAIEVGLAVIAFASQVLTATEIHFARFGLSQARFSLLMALHHLPDRCWTPSALADFLGVRRATLTGLLKVLEKGGWIQRTASLKDARSMEITLSKSGKERFETLQPEHFRRFATALETMPLKERTDLLGLLPPMSKVFKALAEGVNEENKGEKES